MADFAFSVVAFFGTVLVVIVIGAIVLPAALALGENLAIQIRRRLP